MTLEDGVSGLINRIASSSERPVLVAVHGPRDSGKTKFIEEAVQKCREKGLLSVASEGYLPPKSESELKGDSAFRCDVFFFHLIEARRDTVPCINLGIYNPNLQDPLPGDYDIMIINRDSTLKRFPQSR